MSSNQEIKEAIANIASTSKAIEKHCNKPENHNLYSSYLLELINIQLHRQASELKNVIDVYGV
jgi:hypothetical protein